MWSLFIGLNWGYNDLAKHWRKESIEEMEHADKLVERIIFLDGFPNMQVLDPLHIGQNLKEVMDCDLKAEISARTLGKLKRDAEAYLGDTVADVLTVQQARRQLPAQRFLSLAVAPPHLHSQEAAERRVPYEARLREAGADAVIPATDQVLGALEAVL
mgnify:CR=1 FL=1